MLHLRDRPDDLWECCNIIFPAILFVSRSLECLDKRRENTDGRES